MLRGRLSRQRVHLIENQVDESFFGIQGAGDPATIVSIGRLIPLKAPEVLIEAAGRLAAEGRSFRLRFVGPADDPAYLETLRACARGAGVADRVTFLGFVSDAELLSELKGAGILAHSSRVEVAPLAVMQAMAAGRAAVATDVGSTAHLVDEGRTGHLVPPDRPDALAGALARLLDDPATARRLGEAARAEAQERFLPARVVDRTLAVYRALAPSGTTSETGGSDFPNRLELQAIAPASPNPDGEA
jgi:glycosyltransferase involved in cell wall biosynthesis